MRIEEKGGSDAASQGEEQTVFVQPFIVEEIYPGLVTRRIAKPCRSEPQGETLRSPSRAEGWLPIFSFFFRSFFFFSFFFSPGASFPPSRSLARENPRQWRWALADNRGVDIRLPSRNFCLLIPPYDRGWKWGEEKERGRVLIGPSPSLPPVRRRTRGTRSSFMPLLIISQTGDLNKVALRELLRRDRLPPAPQISEKEERKTGEETADRISNSV